MTEETIRLAAALEEMTRHANEARQRCAAFAADLAVAQANIAQLRDVIASVKPEPAPTVVVEGRAAETA